MEISHAYRTSDGKIHDSIFDARQWEQVLAISKLIKGQMKGNWTDEVIAGFCMAFVLEWSKIQEILRTDPKMVSPTPPAELVRAV